MELTNKQKPEVFKKVLKGITKNPSRGLCFLLWESLKQYANPGYVPGVGMEKYKPVPYTDVENAFPLFTRANAMEHGGGPDFGPFWFAIGDTKSRKEFIKWIIKEMENGTL